jgi:hypothetical protein
MLNVADDKGLLQPRVNAANETLLKSQCFGVTTWVHSRHVYRRLCSGDGTKFVDDYVKLA